MSERDALPIIPASQRTPLVEQLPARIEQLLEANRRQAEQIQQLCDELAILRGQRARSKFKPSGAETASKSEADDDADGGDDAGGAAASAARICARQRLRQRLARKPKCRMRMNPVMCCSA